MRQFATFVVAAASVALVLVLAIEKQGAATAPDQAISGELVRCQVSSRSLTLLTADGEGRFVVADDAVIHEGTKTVALADVCATMGHRIKIWYRESGNTRTVHDIRMSLRAMTSHGAGTAERDDVRESRATNLPEKY
jgi:hypothetical protein